MTRPDVGDDVDIIQVPTTGYVDQRPGFYAVHGVSEWLQIWKDPRPDANPPAPPRGVDFDKDMLFVATAPDPNARSMEIKRLIRQPAALHVYATETLGGTHCPQTAATSPPMAIVELESTPLDIQVHLDRVREDECGPPPGAVVLCRVAGSGTPGAVSMVAQPGTKIDCDSNQSRAHAGTIVDRGWQLSSTAPGSTTKLTLGPQSVGVTFYLDAWGTYRVGLEVRDQTHSASATAIIEAPPPDDAIPVELQWSKVDRNDDPSMYPRVELHVADGASPADDCSATAARTWCNVRTTGTVQRALVHPEAGHSYRVFVVYDDFRLKGAAIACVRTFPKGPPLPAGSQPLSVAECDDNIRSAGAIWQPGLIDPASRTLYDPAKGKPTAFTPAPVVTHAPPPPPPPAPTHAPPPAPTATHPPPPHPPTHPPTTDAGAPVPERQNPFAPPAAPERKAPF